MADQLARGIFANFGPSEDPFAAPNGMEDNLRLIDDHLGIYTLTPPVAPGTALPSNAENGAGQIFSNGSYAVFNAGAWVVYPARKGLQVTAAAGDDVWLNTGSGWSNVIAQAVLEQVTEQASLAATARIGAEAARDAAMSAHRVWPSTAAGLGQGVQSVTGLTAGTGGANGTFALSFSGGTQVIAPAGRFTVAGGAVVSITIDYPGYYSSGTPTLGFGASAGLTGAAATAVMGPNTPLGQYFAVPSTLVGEGTIVYRVGAGPAANEAFRTVAPVALSRLTPRTTPFINPPPLDSPLYRILDITFKDGVSLGAYTRIFPRYCFRDAPGGTPRFQFYLAAFDGVSTVVDIVGVGASGSSMNPAGLTGQVLIPLRAISGSAFAGIANGEIVAYMRFDFGAGEDIPNLAYTWADAGLYVDKLKVAQPVRDVIVDVARQQVRATAIISDQSPWLAAVEDPFLRDWIKEIHVEGADPGHEHIVSQVEAIMFSGPLYRWQVRLRDKTLGIDVCEVRMQSNVLPTTADLLEEWSVADQGALAGYTGIQAMIRFNWAAVDWTKSLTTYTTAEQAGIQRSCLHTNDQMDAFLERPNPRKEITVGAAGSHTALQAAIASIYRYGLVPNNQATTLPWSNRCGYGHQVAIRVLDDNFVGDLNEALMAPYLSLIGKGIDNTLFWHQSPDASERLLEFRHSGLIQDLTLEQRGPAYIVHCDDANGSGRLATVGPAIQRHRIRQVLRRVRLRKVGAGAWGFGCGISSGQTIVFDECVFENRAPSDSTALIGIHTSPGSVLPGLVRFRRCVGDHAQRADVVLISGFAQESLNECRVEGGGGLGIIFLGSSMADNYASMPNRARMRVTWDVYGDAPASLSDDRMEVLRVAPGTAVGGNAAAVLFGAGYDQKHGRGELLVMEENAQRKLGARLGDCRSATKTLTLGGVPHVFSNDYRAMSEAAILAEMNSTFTANPVSVVNLAPFVVLGSMSRIYMQASAAIGAKRFVKIQNGKAAPTTGRPDGFAMEAMAVDDADNIILDRSFAASLIPELAGIEGEFGLAAGGQASTSAVPKVGMVHRGLVTLY